MKSTQASGSFLSCSRQSPHQMTRVSTSEEGFAADGAPGQPRLGETPLCRFSGNRALPVSSFFTMPCSAVRQAPFDKPSLRDANQSRQTSCWRRTAGGFGQFDALSMPDWWLAAPFKKVALYIFGVQDCTHGVTPIVFPVQVSS